jgi:hypothetical protein
MSPNGAIHPSPGQNALGIKERSQPQALKGRAT